MINKSNLSRPTRLPRQSRRPSQPHHKQHHFYSMHELTCVTTRTRFRPPVAAASPSTTTHRRASRAAATIVIIEGLIVQRRPCMLLCADVVVKVGNRFSATAFFQIATTVMSFKADLRAEWYVFDRVNDGLVHCDVSGAMIFALNQINTFLNNCSLPRKNRFRNGFFLNRALTIIVISLLLLLQGGVPSERQLGCGEEVAVSFRDRRKPTQT